MQSIEALCSAVLGFNPDTRNQVHRQVEIEVCGCSIEFIFSSTIPSIMLLGVLHRTDHSYNVACLCSRSRTCVRTDASSSEGWANSRSFTLKQAQYFCTLLPSNSVDSSSQPCLGGVYVSTNSPLCTFSRPHSFHSLTSFLPTASRLPADSFICAPDPVQKGDFSFEGKQAMVQLQLPCPGIIRWCDVAVIFARSN